MAAWRRRALSEFPELRAELAARGSVDTPMLLWFELLPLARDAHRRNDVDLLRRIYGYAAWSFDQSGGQLSNAVAVAFYEHLFDEAWMRPLVVPWLRASIFHGLRPLLDVRLPHEELAEVDRLYRALG